MNLNMLDPRFGFGNLPLLSPAITRSISAENPTGEPGGGARELPGADHPASNLGRGWKVRPSIVVPGGALVTIADIEGPASIQHIWITVNESAYRDCVLRMYWDRESTPSVEVPLGDFFANAHGLRYNVSSLPIAVNPRGGFNSYWPMPFRQSAKITIENQSPKEIGEFYYQITYSLQEIPAEAAYFHAQWRRATSSRALPEHTILDGVRGEGHYVGTALSWTQFSTRGWYEGEIKFFIDGDKDYPTICGTGTEDYFGGAWGFRDTYSTAFLGRPLWVREPGEVPKHGLYRWHILDPIRFKKDLRITIQTLGHWGESKFEPLEDDIASVAYWYQVEPHAKFPVLPERHARWPR